MMMRAFQKLEGFKKRKIPNRERGIEKKYKEKPIDLFVLQIIIRIS